MNKKTPAPQRAGTSKRSRAASLARWIVAELEHDPEALAAVAAVARLAARKKKRHR